jgi:hypothetical protein
MAKLLSMLAVLQHYIKRRNCCLLPLHLAALSSKQTHCDTPHTLSKPSRPFIYHYSWPSPASVLGFSASATARQGKHCAAADARAAARFAPLLGCKCCYCGTCCQALLYSLSPLAASQITAHCMLPCTAEMLAQHTDAWPALLLSCLVVANCSIRSTISSKKSTGTAGEKLGQ